MATCGVDTVLWELDWGEGGMISATGSVGLGSSTPAMTSAAALGWGSSETENRYQ